MLVCTQLHSVCSFTSNSLVGGNEPRFDAGATTGDDDGDEDADDEAAGAADGAAAFLTAEGELEGSTSLASFLGACFCRKVSLPACTLGRG
jgi:hypothetical protein